MRRFTFLSSLATAVVALMISAPASASTPPPELAGFVPDYTQPIPFLAQGQSATVGGVTVTATTNTGVSGGTNTYLHQSNARLQTILTFSPPIPGFQVTTRNHADCSTTIDAGPGCFEKYTFTGKNATSQVVFGSEINNSNETTSYVPGATNVGNLTGLVSTLQIDYTYDTGITGGGVANFNRGSYLELSLTDSSIAPATQTMTGNPGASITASTAYTAKGFAGAVTYAVTSGTLPDGLKLDATTGVISGTPTSTSAATVTITATGASFGLATATVTFSLTSPPTTAAPATTATTAAPKVSSKKESATPKNSSELPSTGSSDSAATAWGLALLAVGATTIALGRRRQATKP